MQPTKSMLQAAITINPFLTDAHLVKTLSVAFDALVKELEDALLSKVFQFAHNCRAAMRGGKVDGVVAAYQLEHFAGGLIEVLQIMGSAGSVDKLIAYTRQLCADLDPQYSCHAKQRDLYPISFSRHDDRVKRPDSAGQAQQVDYLKVLTSVLDGLLAGSEMQKRKEDLAHCMGAELERLIDQLRPRDQSTMERPVGFAIFTDLLQLLSASQTSRSNTETPETKSSESPSSRGSGLSNS